MCRGWLKKLCFGKNGDAISPTIIKSFLISGVNLINLYAEKIKKIKKFFFFSEWEKKLL